VTSGTADVTVNDGTTAQTWEGFGGCFNEMGWNQLSTAALQTQAIQALFGTGTDGAHFVIGRIPIGSSDYAMNRYTLDDATGSPGNDPVANTAGSNRPAADASMANFSITRDTQKLIPYIQAALAVNPNIRLWASPWTPPVWMKTGYKTASGAPAGGNATRPSYFDGGNMKSDTTTLNSYAQYLVKWLQAYKAQGITVETVSAQNEPGYDQNYPSCLWDSATYVNFIKVLGPALSAASLSTKVMGGTMSNPNDSSILSALMGDATAKTYIGVVGVQWGMLDSAVSSPSTFSAYGVPLWATEHKCGNYPWNTSTYVTTAPNDQAYGVESWGYIRDAITKARVTAYNAWNMVLDNVGLGIDTSRNWAQDSLLTVSGGTLTKTPAYYVFRHFSQFVDPGAKVVGTAGSGDAVAFKNPDGSIVAVVYNSGAAKTSIVTVGGTRYQFSMPGNGWATIKK
jgi:glucosylceramidase